MINMTKTKGRDIQNQLRRYRKLSGLTQKEAGAILGVASGSQISGWEQGVSTPNLVNCIKLAALYSTWVDGLYIDLIREIRTEVRADLQKWMDAKDKTKGIRNRQRHHGRR